MENNNKSNANQKPFLRAMVDCRFLADEAMKKEEAMKGRTKMMYQEDKKTCMEKVRLYHKPMFVLHLDMVSRLEAEIEESDALKGKKYNWIGTCTLTKTNPNNGTNYEVGGMALACFDNEKAIAILAESDMGLVEQFMKELEGYQKIYLFNDQDYEAFRKYDTKNLEIVMA